MGFVDNMIKRSRLKSPWIVHFDCGSCNGCDIEVLACLTPMVKQGSTKLGRITKPSQTAAIGDSGRPVDVVNGQPITYVAWMTWTTGAQSGGNWKMPTGTGPKSGTEQPAARHSGRANIIFADGHAEAVAFAALNSLENKDTYFCNYLYN